MDQIESNENSRLLPAIPSSSQYVTESVENEMSSSSGDKSVKWPQYVAALSATGGALAAGAVLGWTSPAGPLLIGDKGEYNFHITKEQFSWIGAVMTLGAAICCIPIGLLINVLGRKLTMLILVIPFSLGWILLIWAQNFEMMIIGRILLGIAGGAFCVTAPVYTGEIAQSEIRGSLGGYFQLMVTVGILFVYAVGSGVSVFVLSIICGCIPLVFCAIFFFMPETPLYLVSKGDMSGAKKSLIWLRGDKYDYNSELEELDLANKQQKENPVSTWAALKRPATIKGLVIGMGLMFFQQMSGINAVIFYTQDIFEAANTGIGAEIATIIVGVMQVVATFISTLVVDKLGRRILLLVSIGVMVICTILLGVFFFLKDKDEKNVEGLGWLPIVSLCIFIIVFSLGFGPVPWMLCGELFAPDIKGLASSFAGTLNWTLAFIVTKTFENLQNAIGLGQTFWLFSALSLIGTIFVFVIVPETKGKSLQEIQSMLANEKRPLEPASTETLTETI